MNEDIFTLLSFNAKHHCWSRETREYDASHLKIHLLTSYPVIGKTDLYTVASIYGMKSDVKTFLTKLKNSVNVKKIISTSQYYDNFNKNTVDTLLEFIVSYSDTITTTVSNFNPLSFNVNIFNGIEQWNVYFVNPKRYQIGHLLKSLDSNFDINNSSVKKVSNVDLYRAPDKFYLNMGEVKFIEFLMESGFFKSPR